jgi:hypothetical protein
LASKPAGLSEVAKGASFATQLHVLAVGSLGSAAALVAIKTRYPAFAPVTEVQLRLTGSATFVTPLVGDNRLGAGSGAAPTVVNDHCDE